MTIYLDLRDDQVEVLGLILGAVKLNTSATNNNVDGLPPRAFVAAVLLDQLTQKVQREQEKQ
jgi:hypothetical protein